MPLWKLTPLNADDPNWEASVFRDSVIVRADDSRIARLLAARAFGIATKHRAGEAVKIVPWDYRGLVRCEEVPATEDYTEEGEPGIVHPAEAVGTARRGYQDSIK